MGSSRIYPQVAITCFNTCRLVKFSWPEDQPGIPEAEVEWPSIKAGPTAASHPARYILSWEAGQLRSVLLTNETRAAIPLITSPSRLHNLRAEVSLMGSNLVSAPLIIVPPRGDNFRPTATMSTTAATTTVRTVIRMSTATKVTLSVAVTALVVLTAVLAVMVAVLRQVTARKRRGGGEVRAGRTNSNNGNMNNSTNTLLSFENFLEKNRLSHIHLSLM
jgi:hypothetical protein